MIWHIDVKNSQALGQGKIAPPVEQEDSVEYPLSDPWFWLFQPDTLSRLRKGRGWQKVWKVQESNPGPLSRDPTLPHHLQGP